ncbi:formimidoyltransferase-cyclodeaminase-like isoform X2 [Saccostrea echinata]|uniref:formimidoyltransferase-cyclodeaminase-like isoform X2 n=1 Tax=Saccostrea echinata TaxID=191078 RepID=UPI002A7F89F6|nr:formimidoyltransferase-cyclodeaminase-like isoform X2 [Saccostrea echinata]
MPRIVECVPNFSEGRNKEVIEAIANAIASTEGCNLLDVDPGASTNRTVYTFVGSPEAIVEGALNGARVAYQAIDMRRHKGEHPRMGALDVCPFIPVQNVTMEECVECAKEFGEKLALELGVPVYLYAEATENPDRKSLPYIRQGEYEGLPEKLSQPDWKPDFGSPEFVPNWGATVTGARNFLIAYNINLLSTKEQAHRIALNIREQGRGKEQPGRLKHVQAIGWYLEEANMAQVSVNITDYEVTPIHKVYEEVNKDAQDLDLAVCGSQIVGLIPLKAILQAAEYYMKKENLFILEEDQKLRLVINRLGLNSLGPFSPKERIIEYMISDDADGGPLISMDVRDFVMTVGSRSPSPGGGSVSALAASLGASLGSMVGFLTYGNKKYYELDSKMRQLIPPLYKAMKDLMQFVDADAAAYSEYMLATKLPKETEEDRMMRDYAMQEGLKTAIQVPLTVSRIANQLWPTIKELATICNINCKSDLQVGVRMLETGVWGTFYNVNTNLADLKDPEFTTQVKEEISAAIKYAQEECAAILKILEGRKE